MSLNVFTAGEGSPLLLLHGFTGTAQSWSPLAQDWSARHRVIAPDLLGHGRSDAPPDPGHYALERQADRLAELLHLLEAVPAAVVGYSMGARLALQLVVAHADVVSRLVLESPSAGIADPDARAERRAADERLATELEVDGLVSFVDGWEASPMFASQAALPEEVRERLRAQRLSHDPVGLAASLRGAGQGAMTPLQGHLGAIAVPTLVIVGMADATGAERGRGVAEGIPGARLETVAGAGHNPHLERPGDYDRLISDFLSATPTAPTH